MEVHGGGEVLEAGQLLSFHFFFFFGEHIPVEGLFVFEQMPEHTGCTESQNLLRIGSCEESVRKSNASAPHGRDRFHTVPIFSLVRNDFMHGNMEIRAH